MPDNSVDLLRSMNQGALDREMAKWEQLDTLVKPEHPMMQEYERIRAQAQTIITQRMPMTFGMTEGQGLELFEKEAEKLAELYEKAERIRSQMATDNMRTTFDIPEGTTFNAAMEAEVEAATEGLGSRAQPIQRKLLQIAQGLGKNAADIREGDTEGNFFFFGRGPAAGMVDFDRVAEAQAFLDDLKRTENVTPELSALAQRLQIGIDQMRQIDPLRAQDRARWDAFMAGKGKTDMKPLRVVGALLGGLITAFGLGRNAYQVFKGETPSINAATFGWAAITMFSINPKLLQNAPARAIDQIAALGRPDVRKVIANGWKGEEGKKALEELQEVRSNNGALLRRLMGQKSLNNAQIAALADDGETPLVRVLSRMKEEDRPQALRVMGARLDDGQVELLNAMMDV